jgi:hypothetical protein
MRHENLLRSIAKHLQENYSVHALSAGAGLSEVTVDHVAGLMC